MLETPALLKRVEVPRSDRIAVLEREIRKLKPSNVLELGAGDYSFDYTGDPERCRWIKADYAPPCDVVCDLNQPRITLPFESSSFDLVVCTEVLEHLCWPQAVLREAYRLLRPDGRILISVPNAVSLSYRFAWLFGHIPSCAACGNLEFGPTTYKTEAGEALAGHVIDFSASRLRTLLHDTGFKVVSMKGSGIHWRAQVLPHWLLPPSLASNLICLAAPV